MPPLFPKQKTLPHFLGTLKVGSWVEEGGKFSSSSAQWIYSCTPPTSDAQLTSSITWRVTISVRATSSVSTCASDTNMTYVSEKWNGRVLCSVVLFGRVFWIIITERHLKS